MVHLYATNVGNLPDPKVHPEIMDTLWTERKEKILRYKQVEDRKLCAGAGLLLKSVLELHSISIEKLQYGKKRKPEVEGIYFNLSHSGDMVICAVSEKTVGCDIERISHIKEGIAEHFFTTNEIRYLNSFEKEARENEFFRLWTMKEAYMKMTGEGMSLGLNRFDIVIGDSIEIYRDGELCSCEMKEYDVSGYKVSVCAEETDFSEHIDYVEFYK